MIELNVDAQGVQQIRDALQNLPEAIDAAVEDVAKTMRELVLGRTPVGEPGRDPHSGQLKRSWSDVRRSEGGFSFSTDLFYATTLEEGLYERVGPRTMAAASPGGGSGIFSRQAPGGIIAPLLEDEGVLRRVAELVVEQILKGVADAGA